MSTDDPTQPFHALGGPEQGNPSVAPGDHPDEMWERLQRLPSIRDEPLRWDPLRGEFVGGPGAAPPGAQPEPSGGSSRRIATSAPGHNRHVVIGPGVPAGTPAAATVPPPRAVPRPGHQPTRQPPRQPPGAPPSRPRPARAPGPGRAPRGRRRGRLLRRLATATVLLLVLFACGAFGLGWIMFNRIEKVDVASVLSKKAGAGTNYLIVGTDSREGISASDPNADAFLGGGFSDSGPSRTDTIMILRMEGGHQRLLSIPRDLWVKYPGGGEGRINAQFQKGRAVLISTIEQNIGIPIHDYMEINFVSFASLVDAVGGIDIDFATPARDQHSGLFIYESGVHRLDGVTALAFVRSRYYEEQQPNGKWVQQAQSDLARVERQRQFLSALMGKIGSTKNPLSLLSIGNSMTGGGMKLDNKLTYFDALGLAWQFRSFHPDSETLPAVDRGDHATLKLAPDASSVIAGYQ